MHWAIDITFPDSKVLGANIGPTWVLLAPNGPHVGPMNFAIWVVYEKHTTRVTESIFLSYDSLFNFLITLLDII